jgi:CheY-like chemotaxis protein
MPHVLVIDDDPSVCHVIEKILDAAGYTVVTATSGSAGLDAASEQVFAAAIIDLCMPYMHGLDTIRALRAQCPGTRLILMSGLMSDCAGVNAPDFLGLAANLQGIPRLGKPFRREELLELLAQCCVAGWAGADKPGDRAGL